ncbi:hypothetical protein PUNSTDRAFT_130322 [Punctularia strigosozonata HHB-11173 SS5]|uniref:uncharacterized protein n=1 Tax=Punctularia strigosozonata (strain HHB-11173) TaxID=741275 RepID=UPI0004416A31|nr:uncharacterized protein PUNSTDRAFT_130322 [Punctularia strigosozonata HHB-11173 SS5]EIN14698.1 hypothetical protein PUNSTDRAFT_130322 [Punctularia strigosozonata HHB-11173 SS5]
MPLRPSTPSTSSTTPTPSHHGLRSGLLHLLPRHTLFNVRLVIHGLTNVPYVRGEFGVKWKFSKVQAAHHGDPPASSLSLSVPQTSEPDSGFFSSSERGMTPYVPLVEHATQWEHTVGVVVQMGLHRETSELLPNELKLQVVQAIQMHQDIQDRARSRSTLLSMRIRKRYYPLPHSKTNALLKLTLQLDYVSGDKSYVAPPLAKGEIMAGVSGILLNQCAPQRPRATPYSSTYAANSALSLADSGTHSHDYTDLDAPFDALHLVSEEAESEQGTERLIEALFNPRDDGDRYHHHDGERRRRQRANGSGKGRRGARPWWRLRKAYHTRHPDANATAEKYAALGLLGPEHTVRGRPPMLSAETGSDPGGYVRMDARTGKGRGKNRPPMLSGITGSEGFVKVNATPA